jgi:hypothetical protein
LSSIRVTNTGYELAEDLRLLVELVEEDYPDAETIVLVTDNLSTHKVACLYERFEPQQARRMAQKIEWHYAPEHGSWLNIAECELSVLQRQCLKRRVLERDLLTTEVAVWKKEHNKNAATIDWHFTTADARTKLKCFYPVFKEQ